ncbi:hypothetical protein [Methanogenium organophilum]|uniref:Uncharacterized protein n=1 Tax=Methanogenium organophilum TaxID=2199 RepID=A0A9X9S4Z6_METOG|nr:hypothetical protein [Methanogenium organophilum]WAI02044.1 hypothetical protein OU421_04015 [Methanogenium organophilum]
MFELFTVMFKEEWRMHSTLFGSLNFALFPVLICAIAFMGAFLLPLIGTVMDISVLVILAHGNFALLGIMVGSFGIMGKEIMNRRFGQASLIAYSARSLPVSEKRLFLNFVVKDIVYYFILWVLPFCMGFILAAPVLGMSLYYPFLTLLTLTLSFLTGLCAVFLLSSGYSRSKTAFVIVIAILVLAAALFVFGYNGEATALFPPLAVFYSFSAGTLVISVGVILILFALSMVFFTSEYQSAEKHYTNRLIPLSQRLAMLPQHDLVAKDFIDLYRSGIGIGQTLFSFLLPLGLIWMILSVMGGFLSPEKVLFMFAVVTGVISSTMYTWLTEFDAVASYMFLPLRVSSVMKAKIESFTVLQIVPVISLICVALSSGTAAYIPHALVIALSTSFFALAVMVRFCGLAPSTLIYNARIFLTYILLTGPAVLILITLTFASPLFAFAGIILLVPAWHLIQSGFEKWDNTDVAGF